MLPAGGEWHMVLFNNWIYFRASCNIIALEVLCTLQSWLWEWRAALESCLRLCWGGGAELWTSTSQISDLQCWEWFWSCWNLGRWEISPGSLSAFLVSWLWPFASHDETKGRHLTVTGYECSKGIPKDLLFLTPFGPLVLSLVKIDREKISEWAFA